MDKNKYKFEYKTKIFTGIRPTGSLTIANVLGAVHPLIQLQEDTGDRPLVFVADMHALTDNEPSEIRDNVANVVVDYLSLGLDPEKVDIFIQSEIRAQVLELTALLSREISIAELIRIPTLKEKLKDSKNPENANTFLAFYPIMMAADILLQRAQFVPVGEDQEAHIEMTRTLAKKFNKKYGNVLPLPQSQQVEQLRILSLDGNGKMSKSTPSTAIFLSDDEKIVKDKIKRATTAFEKEMPPVLESHFIVARGLATSDEHTAELDRILEQHLKGEKVMGDFKKVLTDIVNKYLANYRESRERVMDDHNLVSETLSRGIDLARENADETIQLVRESMEL